MALMNQMIMTIFEYMPFLMISVFFTTESLILCVFCFLLVNCSFFDSY